MAETGTATKPGWKTTEFWLSLVATLVGLFIASGALPEESVVMKIAGFVLAALVSLGYGAMRASVKKAEADGEVVRQAAVTIAKGVDTQIPPGS